MSRRLCLIICAAQLIIFISLIAIPNVTTLGSGFHEIGERVFMGLGLLFVFFSPFGIMSLFLSLGFISMSQSEAFRPALLNLMSSKSPVMRLVWKELHKKLDGEF